MAHNISIPRYYITKADNKRMKEFENISGDSRYQLINQFVRGLLSKHRDYYVSLAKMDRESRGITPQAWIETIMSEGYEGLPPCREPISPPIESDPLFKIELPDKCLQMCGNYIKLSQQNCLLFKTMVYYSPDGTIAKTIGRIIREHVERTWYKIYYPQVKAANSSDWLE
jgi:hypothetical protein